MPMTPVRSYTAVSDWKHFRTGMPNAFRSCYEINYTDCAGWFFEIKEENAAVPGYGEAL